MRVTLKGGTHFFCFGQIHCHSGLAKHMLARFERGNRDHRVQVGWCPDPYDVDVFFCYQFIPVRVGFSLWQKPEQNVSELS